MIAATKSFAKRCAIEWLLWKERRVAHPGIGRAGWLHPDNWGCSIDSQGRMLVAGVSINDLFEKFGTPLHVLHEAELMSTYKEFLASFRTVYPNTSLATSYKTNPIPYVLRLLHNEGSLAEVISHFELWLALRLGVPPNKIILNGPGKGDEALRLAVEKNIKLINIDGLAEVEKLALLARARGVKQAVGLRVTTSVGWASQFGLSIAGGDAANAFGVIRKYGELEPVGLHLHLGSGIQSVETYVRAVGEVIEFGRLLKSEFDIDISVYDLGGGFGVPTVRGKSAWDSRMISLGYAARQPIPHLAPHPEDYANALRPLLMELRRGAAEHDNPQVVLEPGRAITSTSQILLLSIIGRKSRTHNNTVLIVDGGKNITMPLEWETHQLYPTSKLMSECVGKYDIFGPLCHPGDIIGKNIDLPEMSEGDVLAIMDAGAYFVPNQTNFSNPRPPVISVLNGEPRIVRQRESFDDMIRVDEI